MFNTDLKVTHLVKKHETSQMTKLYKACLKENP